LDSMPITCRDSEVSKVHGGHAREAGDAFREANLAPGFSIDPMSAIERFFGTRPDVAPLLRRRGLAEPVASEDEPADEDAPGGPDTEAGDPAPDAADPPPDAAGATDEPKQHANHAKVETALRERGIEPQVRVFNDATPTAASAAEKLDIEV